MVQQNIQSRYTITETVCVLLYNFVRNLMEKIKRRTSLYVLKQVFPPLCLC